MTDHPLLRDLRTLSNPAAQKAWLTAQRAALDDAAITALKLEADRTVREDARASLAIADLLYHAAALTGNPRHRALALFAEANAWSIGGLGDYQRAIDLCDEAATIYAHLDAPVDGADAQVTKIYALAMMGRYDEALAAGAWAESVLAAAHEWRRLATVLMNVAIVHGRRGADMIALDFFDRAAAHYQQAGPAGVWSLPGVAMNRALVLRNLGRFAESLTANQTAIDLLRELGQHAEVGHAQQTLAFTYYVLGRYNEALALLDATHQTFATYDRQADLLLTDLYRSHCLLAMRHFGAVVAGSDDLITLAARLAQPFEEGLALFNKAQALAGLQQAAAALDLLTAARALFTGDGNAVWAAEAEVAAAHLLLRQARPTAALERAERGVALFTAHQLPIHTARAQLLAAEAQLQLDGVAAAAPLLAVVDALATTHHLPNLQYQTAYLLGQVAEQQGETTAALAHYARALRAVEQLRSRLMVEHRADFVADKARIYTAAVQLSLAQGRPAAAHAYAERARSRALHDLLALRLDLTVHARSADDALLVAELNELRTVRDQHYRRTRYAQNFAALLSPTADAATDDVVTELTALEARIGDLWQTLLVRNADYARADWQGEAPSEPLPVDDGALLATLQRQLPAKTALLSYYVAERAVTLFVVTAGAIHAEPLSITAEQIGRLVELLRLNLGMAAASAPERLPALLLHAQKILHQLYQQLLASAYPHCAAAEALIIIPHGPLHYLPFHALVTQLDAAMPANSRYLLDAHMVSYLPSATFLAQEDRRRDGAGAVVAFGHSYNGQLPHTVAEAQAIAALTGGAHFVETAATKAALHPAAATAQVIHLATHGDFRADNPLFSGLALEDGWLSTLDIFHLRTAAGLVVLSACQTGRNVIGGGDEQLGLMRAFLAAGAASLIVTLWTVHDESTATLMQHFYRALLAGETKAAALRQAQLALRHSTPHAHPYYWAPFRLVGDSGPL
jgi:CHAT domain-containing protein